MAVALDGDTLAGASWGDSVSRESEGYAWDDNRWEWGTQSEERSLRVEAAGTTQSVATARCESDDQTYSDDTTFQRDETSSCSHGAGAAGAWVGVVECERSHYSSDSAYGNWSWTSRSCMVPVEQRAPLPSHGPLPDNTTLVAAASAGEAGGSSCGPQDGEQTCQEGRELRAVLLFGVEGRYPLHLYAVAVPVPEVLP